MKHILFTGDSHLGALKRAFTLDSSLEEAPLTFWPLGKGGGTRELFFESDSGFVKTNCPHWRNRVYSEETLSSISEDMLLVVSLPMNTSRILRDHNWVRHAPWRLAHEEIALSDAVISALIEQDSQHCLSFVSALRDVWNHVAVLEAPRLFGNASYLSRTRLDICTYVDASYRAQVSGRLSDEGIDIIPQPSETIGENGTTDLMFDHENNDDDHHANAKYGLIALRAVIDYAKSG